MENINTYNDYHEADVDLLPTFWNKDKERAWRMDIDILTADDDDSDEETDEESGEDQCSESENEMNDDQSD